MGSLDQTILATALPTIGRDFGDVHNLPWLITAYLIASTAATPLYGKISDIHGRRFTLRVALSMYMVGSLVCALSPNMLVLILGRVLHGLGGGGRVGLGVHSGRVFRFDPTLIRRERHDQTATGMRAPPAAHTRRSRRSIGAHLFVQFRKFEFYIA